MRKGGKIAYGWRLLCRQRVACDGPMMELQQVELKGKAKTMYFGFTRVSPEYFDYPLSSVNEHITLHHASFVLWLSARSSDYCCCSSVVAAASGHLLDTLQSVLNAPAESSSQRGVLSTPPSRNAVIGCDKLWFMNNILSLFRHLDSNRREIVPFR